MGQCSGKSSTDVRTNMSSQDYDQLEMLNGHWKFDRDENLEAFFAAAGMFYANFSVLIEFSQKTSVFYLLIISSS